MSQKPCSRPYLASLSGLANVYTKKKDHGQALRLMEECLEQRVKGDTPSDTTLYPINAPSDDLMTYPLTTL